MSSLDDLVKELFPEQIVTGIYAVSPRSTRSLRFVNAGHVPGLVTRADGACLLMLLNRRENVIASRDISVAPEASVST